MEPKGPFCQSCGMPLENPDCFGTDERGLMINDYCIHCFENGMFTNSNISKEEMIDLMTDLMVEKAKIPEEQARQISETFIPTLKRWRDK